MAWPTRDGTIKVWNMKTHEEEFAFHGHPPFIGSLAFSRDGQHLFSVGHDSIVRIWGLTAPVESRIILRARCFGDVAFTSDGRRLAVAQMNSGPRVVEQGRVKIFDLQSGQELLRLDAVGNLRFSPDDRWLATNRADGSVTLWDAKTGREIRKLAAAGHRNRRVAVSPDGQHLASGTDKGKILIWNLSDDEPPLVLGGLADLVSAVHFSSDGRKLATCDRHGKVIIWNNQWKIIEQRQLPFTTQVMAFSPDGERLAIAGESTTINIWHLATGEEFRELHGHADWVSGLAFSPDGARLVSGGADETVRLWDVSSGEENFSTFGSARDGQPRCVFAGWPPHRRLRNCGPLVGNRLTRGSDRCN